MPALLNTYLFVEPDDNYLDYGSTVLHQIVVANAQSGQKITELMGTDANPNRIKQELAASKPYLLCRNRPRRMRTRIPVENLAILLQASNPDELALMKDRIIDLCSCLTAVNLGPALIDAGAVSYLGYNQEFWFYTGDAAGATRAVQSPFLAEFAFIASLMRGKSVGQSRQDQLARYDEEIAYWISGDGKNHPDAAEPCKYSSDEQETSTLLGESAPSSGPSGGVTFNLQIPVPVTLGIAVASVAYLLYRTIA